MEKKLKILHLEDLSSDAALVARELKKGKIDAEIKLVDSRADFKKALVSFFPDIVLCDHSLAAFDSLEALKIINESENNVPFILVTATVSEKFAVDMIHQGAADYILKDRLQRLPEAVRNVTEKKKAETERLIFLEALKHSEERYRQIVETAQEGICLLDENDQIIFMNKKLCEILGYDAEEIVGKKIFHCMDKAGKQAAIKALQTVKLATRHNIDLHFITKKGKDIWTSISANPIFNDNKTYKGILGMVSDITEKKMLMQKLVDFKVDEQKNIMKAIVNAQEKERVEIGMELHDNVSQLLVASKIFLEHGLSKQDYKPSYLQCKEGIVRAMEEIRKLSHVLVGPTQPFMMGLIKSIEKLIDVISIVQEMKVNFLHEDYYEKEEEGGLNLVIYRIIQEQLNNILKHSGASEIQIEISNNTSQLILVIKDNGSGFDTSVKRPGIGLINIINRAKMYNGTVRIISSPGHGCQIRIVFDTSNSKNYKWPKPGIYEWC